MSSLYRTRSMLDRDEILQAANLVSNSCACQRFGVESLYQDKMKRGREREGGREIGREGGR